MQDKKIMIYMVIAVSGAWLLAPFFISWLYTEMPERGQFGDLYGSVNSLFSGLAFVALFYTILLQQRQLELQRSDLELQRQDLKLQREEMAASRAELANQVRMQHALFRATVAQINVAAVNAQIEAKKMQSESVSPGFRKEYWEYIETAASVLSDLADKLETEHGA